MEAAKQVIRWVLFLGCIAFGLLALNGAFAAWWVSWGPPTDYPAAWEQEAIRRLGISISLLFTGPMAFVAMKPEFSFRKSKFKFVWALVVLVSLAYSPVRAFIQKDACLDAGGSWKEGYFVCEYEQSHNK
ncbi:MAG: hypothetical protein H6953_15130 [Chromatiaceae bacterium]|nr:hypothetical protein [Chromatiaceae bacterium]MCP5421723.1 hypothetical protein [Chromatiaceae bacterium]